VNRVLWAIPDITEDDIEAVNDVMKSGYVSGTGPVKKEFEKAFAERVKAKYAIATCNGTMSLILGLMAIKEVIGYNYPIIAVPTFTFIATVNTANLMGDIGFVDAKRSTFNINPKDSDIADIIMPVDVGGCPVDYDELIGKKSVVFADSAEAVGAEYKGRPVGGIANLHSFSFHATKILTTGEGGMVTTNNEEIYDWMLSLCNQGYVRKKVGIEYIHSRIGYNFRMTEMQAALGLSQLKRLDYYLNKREQLYKIYKDIIGDLVTYQKIPKDRKSSYFLASVLVKNPKVRNEVALDLNLRGIQVKLTWKPVHLQPPYAWYNEYYGYPNAEWIGNRIISLPMHNALTDEEAKHVAETFKKVYKSCLRK